MKVKAARDGIIQAIVDGRLGDGTMKDFYSEALRVFGGIEGVVGMIKAEFDAAEPGSLIRKQYLEMIVKVMVTLSTSGQEEELDKIDDEELARRIEEARQRAANAIDAGH